MEALTISAANLDTIEKNLGAVASELSGVINNVSSVNNQVNKVEEQVNSLNDEVKRLVSEIRETTILTNARQNIMYNDSLLEKNYGYFNKVRRTTESLLDAINHSSINVGTLISLQQELIINNPNYWLANALASLTSWLLNDRTNCEKELNNALRKNSSKTSIFFFLINHKLNRTQTSLNWLKKYLSEQDPYNLDKDFITILDLASTNSIGTEAKNIILDKIKTWQNIINGKEQIEASQINFWKNYITSNEDDDVKMPYLEIYSPNVAVLKNNLTITSSYYNVLQTLEEINSNDFTNKSIDDVLNNLIYDYEEKEQQYKLDNLKNELIISCNGNKEEAEKIYKEQKRIYNKETDLMSLLSNIVIYKDSFKISNETQKIALAIIKPYIIKAYNEKRSQINNDPFSLSINNFTTTTEDGTNVELIRKELEQYLNAQYNDEDKDIFLILLALNIFGIIGIFITLNNTVLTTLLIIILVIGNIILFNKLNKRSKLRTFEKNKLRTTIFNGVEKSLAETIDYKNMMKDDETHYIELINFLNTLEAKDYIRNNNERNINIGEY